MNFILKALIHGILADVPIGGNVFRQWSEEKKKLEESKWVFKKPAIFNEFLTHKFLFIKFSYDNASEIQKKVTNLS